jgi:hypothetical protein
MSRGSGERTTARPLRVVWLGRSVGKLAVLMEDMPGLREPLALSARWLLERQVKSGIGVNS